MRSVLATLLVAQFAATAAAAELRVRYLHGLSDTNGLLPFQAAQLSFDPGEGELYVVADGRVNIFDEHGMSVFSFTVSAEEGGATAAVRDVAVTETGILFVLASDGRVTSVLRCNYRGEVLSSFQLGKLPAGFAEGFEVTGLGTYRGRLYLVDHASMRLVIASFDGRVERTIDLADFFGFSREQREAGLSSFGLSPDGSVLITSAPLFKACWLAPDGANGCFGRAGSAPGRFAILGGIAGDEDGNLFVTDLLRGKVMVFNHAGRFAGEFGTPAPADPASLIKPRLVAVAGGRVFVAQTRGSVKVFGVEVE